MKGEESEQTEEPLKFSIVITNHQKIEGHYIYSIKLTIDNSIIINTGRRFSELKLLNDTMRKETNNNNFPKFPPKKLFPSEEFIKKRQQELNVYFNVLCTSPEFSKLPSLVKFVDTCLKKSGNTRQQSVKSIASTQNKDYIKTKMRSMITPFLEKFKPKYNCEFSNLKEMKDNEQTFMGIVDDYINKFVDIDFQVKKTENAQRETKYKELLGANNVWDDNNEAIEGGTDDNYNLISENVDDNSKYIEEETGIKQTLDDFIKREKEVELIYN